MRDWWISEQDELRMSARLAIMERWKARGLSTRTANALSNEDLDSIEELQAFGELRVRSLPNIGKVSMKEIGELAGWPERSKPSLANIKSQTLADELRRRGWKV